LVRISVRETDESQKMTCVLGLKLKVNKTNEEISTDKLSIYELRKVGRDYLLRSPCQLQLLEQTPNEGAKIKLLFQDYVLSRF
jgi:hypothetical protein